MWFAAAGAILTPRYCPAGGMSHIKSSAMLCSDVMRTTLSLDSDVAARIREVHAKRGGSFKAVVNEALRLGLARLDAPPTPKRRFRTDSVDLGRCLVGSLDDVAETLSMAEGEQFR